MIGTVNKNYAVRVMCISFMARLWQFG